MDAEPDRVGLLKRQLLVTWSLAEVVLNNLTDEECLWCPSTASWTVRPAREGRCEADWVEPEPDEAPPTSLAWVLWHANWWWSMVIDHSFGAGSPTRADVAWAGAADAVASLRGLHDRWVGILDRLSDDDLSSGALTRWPYSDARPFAHVAGWVNIEFMKNVAEMALLRRSTPMYAGGRFQPTPTTPA